MQVNDIYSKLQDRFSTLIDIADNPALWALQKLGIDLFDNQIEIVDAVCDLSVKNVAILQARGAGKSFAVALGLVKICEDFAGMKIGIFGPKADQANRIIKEILSSIITPSSPLHSTIDWDETTKSRLSFINGSEMIAISASENSMNEGWHFNVVVMDECHQISDLSVNQRIIPMLSGLPTGKVIKLGISLYKNNFYKSCNSDAYRILRKDWTQCPNLLATQGATIYKGVEYPTFVVNQLPLSVKERLFPDRPDLHTDGQITELDYKTQYAMEWLSDIDLELTEPLQRALVSGVHDPLISARLDLGEAYFFGLDTAGASIIEGKKDLDYTVLSIWRKMPDNTKEKVACYVWQGNPLQQIAEIKSIINPKDGIFPCMFGLVDYSNIGINIVEEFKRDGVAVEGVLFGSSESTSKKNYKNAMFDQFKFELEHNRIKFPSIDKLDPQPTDTPALLKQRIAIRKSFNEWCAIERHIGLGINAKIQAPSDMHDDHCCADVLAVWAMDRSTNYRVANPTVRPIPAPLTGVVSITGRGIATPGNKSPYLPRTQ